MDFLDLAPIPRVAGTVVLPGSKSISNRTLLLAALAEGTTEVKALLDSDDVSHMLAALKTLGVAWQQQGESRDFSVPGVGGAFPNKRADLFLGNAGTATRFLTAAAALIFIAVELVRGHKRPWAAIPLPLGTFLCLAGLVEIWTHAGLIRWWLAACFFC